MASFANFLDSFNQPLVWVLATIVFLGFMKGLFVVVKAIWKYFKRGVYDL